MTEERNTPVIPNPDKDGGGLHVTADLPPEKRWPVSFQQDAGWAWELVWTLASTGNPALTPRLRSPLPSHYTDYAIPALFIFCSSTAQQALVGQGPLTIEVSRYTTLGRTTLDV